MSDQRGVGRPMGTAWDLGAVEVCQQRPAAPTALKAARRPTSRRLALHWKEGGCFETFSVVVRKGSATGKVVESKKLLTTPKLRTRKLTSGHPYYWRVTVVGDRGNTRSGWQRARVR